MSLEEKKTGTLIKKEYLYIHLQKRYMRVKCKVESKMFEILPDRFRAINRLPVNDLEFHRKTIGFTYLYWFDQYRDKIRRKLKIKSNS